MITVMDKMEFHDSYKLHVKDHHGGYNFKCLESQGEKWWQIFWICNIGSRWAQSLHQTLSIGKLSGRYFE